MVVVAWSAVDACRSSTELFIGGFLLYMYHGTMCCAC
jgi:hypothetical protein